MVLSYRQLHGVIMKVLAVISLLCFVSLGYCQQGNLVELAEKLGAKTLVTLVKEAGLAETLSTGGPFTIFGPTDDAFTKLPRVIIDYLKKNKTALQDVLKYHVVSGKVYSSQLSNELQAASLLTPAKIRINIYQGGKVVTADGSPIVKVDQNAKNGVIHVVDRVMFPIPIESMVDMVKADRQLKTLLAAVTAAGIGGALGADGLTLFAPTDKAFAKLPAGTLDNLLKNKTALTEVLTYHVVKGTAFSAGLTLFAPTDKAFAKLPAGTLDNLLKNKTALTEVLTYHVVKGTAFSAGLTDGEKVATLEGKDLSISLDNGMVKVDNAMVIRPDDAVSNGVIHIIDSVLLPPQYKRHFRLNN
ncbi:transforming growth factor-beta-induced protein ig-h3-like [Mizuhopecten yessoensis]|uniref:transforming growth factor-beta-induced protein ig-h3-like n=1 Tax=Mizuhopecten yessoensis TaxID=6573 RepID=UPI000B45F343|nr:transforming growth factor-beta-induced protein ig-h3-like [Mizuhopecten yessoensis]